MITALKLNWHAILLATLLFVYAARLVRYGRINTRIGVGWLITLGMFIVFCLTGYSMAGAIQRLRLPAVEIGAAVLFAWLALVHINNHARISALTVKLKLIDQEVALLQTRFDRLESAPLSTALVPAISEPPAEQTPSPPLKTDLCTKPMVAVKLASTAAGCAWIVVTVFAFGVFTGFIPPQPSGTSVFTALFDKLQAEYQR